jgi:hypothetical protein
MVKQEMSMESQNLKEAWHPQAFLDELLSHTLEKSSYAR